MEVAALALTALCVGGGTRADPGDIPPYELMREGAGDEPATEEPCEDRRGEAPNADSRLLNDEERRLFRLKRAMPEFASVLKPCECAESDRARVGARAALGE
jgi:hypothetical protein